MHTYQFVDIYKLPLERLSPFMFPQTWAVKVIKGSLPCLSYQGLFSFLLKMGRHKSKQIIIVIILQFFNQDLKQGAEACE